MSTLRDVSGGVIFFDFGLDQPQAVALTVTDKDVASETDF